MKIIICTLLWGCFAIGGLTGCEKAPTVQPSSTGPTSEDPTGEGLVGTWRLTGRRCFCPRTPVPNESVTFTATEALFYQNNQLLYRASYDYTTGGLCGVPGSNSLLRISYTVPSQPATNRLASATLNGNMLVLDYGSPCDAPVDTYTRQ